MNKNKNKSKKKRFYIKNEFVLVYDSYIEGFELLFFFYKTVGTVEIRLTRLIVVVRHSDNRKSGIYKKADVLYKSI